MKKRTILFICFFLFSCAFLFKNSFAQEANNASINVSEEVIEKKMPYYFKSIKQLKQRAEDEIKKVDSELVSNPAQNDKV